MVFLIAHVVTGILLRGTRLIAQRQSPQVADSSKGEPILSINTTTHLNFRGDARPALEFYQGVFGGELSVITYADMGNGDDPATADNVVWGQVTAENGFRIMAYDVYPFLEWDQGKDPFFVSVRGTDASELQGLWDKLMDGATVKQPLEPSQWAPLYGQLTDRFGVTWVLDVAVQYPAS